VGTGQINSPAPSNSTEQNAPSSEPQCRATLPTSRPAIATPSADFDYKSPGHRSNAVSRLRPQVARPSLRRQPTSTASRPLPPQPSADQLHQEAPLQATHNASCVFTERVNKGVYQLLPSINCGPSATAAPCRAPSLTRGGVCSLQRNY
jgi:hypothetical protein